jgi:uncharacterized membrane protein
MINHQVAFAAALRSQGRASGMTIIFCGVFAVLGVVQVVFSGAVLEQMSQDTPEELAFSPATAFFKGTLTAILIAGIGEIIGAGAVALHFL